MLGNVVLAVVRIGDDVAHLVLGAPLPGRVFARRGWRRRWWIARPTALVRIPEIRADGRIPPWIRMFGDVVLAILGIGDDIAFLVRRSPFPCREVAPRGRRRRRVGSASVRVPEIRADVGYPSRIVMLGNVKLAVVLKSDYIPLLVLRAPSPFGKAARRSCCRRPAHHGQQCWFRCFGSILRYSAAAGDKQSGIYRKQSDQGR